MWILKQLAELLSWKGDDQVGLSLAPSVYLENQVLLSYFIVRASPLFYLPLILRHPEFSFGIYFPFALSICLLISLCSSSRVLMFQFVFSLSNFAVPHICNSWNQKKKYSIDLKAILSFCFLLLRLWSDARRTQIALGHCHSIWTGVPWRTLKTRGGGCISMALPGICKVGLDHHFLQNNIASQYHNLGFD